MHVTPLMSIKFHFNIIDSIKDPLQVVEKLTDHLFSVSKSYFYEPDVSKQGEITEAERLNQTVIKNLITISIIIIICFEERGDDSI